MDTLPTNGVLTRVLADEIASALHKLPTASSSQPQTMQADAHASLLRGDVRITFRLNSHKLDRAVKMPSPSLRRQAPHLISFIASRFPWVKHPIDSPHSVQGGGPCRLAGSICRLGLLPVFPHRQGSPVFFCGALAGAQGALLTQPHHLHQRSPGPAVACLGDQVGVTLGT